jgi:hypothetical protein
VLDRLRGKQGLIGELLKNPKSMAEAHCRIMVADLARRSA